VGLNELPQGRGVPDPPTLLFLLVGGFGRRPLRVIDGVAPSVARWPRLRRLHHAASNGVVLRRWPEGVGG
jgi:hypothetical protein